MCAAEEDRGVLLVVCTRVKMPTAVRVSLTSETQQAKVERCSMAHRICKLELAPATFDG